MRGFVIDLKPCSARKLHGETIVCLHPEVALDASRIVRASTCQICPMANVACDLLAEPAEIPAKSRGLGDTIAKVTKAIGIKPCGGCKKRQEKLNELFPYGESPP